MPSEDTTSPSGRARSFALRHWVALILVALAAIFIAQNRERVDIHILWTSFAAPIWFFFAGLLVVGVLVGLLLGRRRRS